MDDSAKTNNYKQAATAGMTAALSNGEGATRELNDRLSLPGDFFPVSGDHSLFLDRMSRCIVIRLTNLLYCWLDAAVQAFTRAYSHPLANVFWARFELPVLIL